MQNFQTKINEKSEWKEEKAYEFFFFTKNTAL